MGILKARIARRLVILPVAGLLSASCGYSLAGRGSFLPASIRTIGVPLFVNRTPYFNVEEVLTEKVRAEFIGRGRYKVVPEATGVDAVLTGEISNISVVPASFTGQQQASRYVIILTVKIEFRDITSNQMLWENPNLVFREEYDAASGTSAVDPSAFFGQESNALERVSTDFARSVISAILEAF